mmetsp:Transcript_34267/g.65455  ORF Transcript_34267/g.65455 Transcript_34267/m.65455 type:complete len:213 (+) Transcript_34267:567-1205(+)
MRLGRGFGLCPTQFPFGFCLALHRLHLARLAEHGRDNIVVLNHPLPVVLEEPLKSLRVVPVDVLRLHIRLQPLQQHHQGLALPAQYVAAPGGGLPCLDNAHRLEVLALAFEAILTHGCDASEASVLHLLLSALHAVVITACPYPFALQETLVLVNALQVIRLWAGPTVTHDQVPAVLAHKAHILFLLLTLTLLPVLGHSSRRDQLSAISFYL